jgi:hypothetical protein
MIPGCPYKAHRRTLAATKPKGDEKYWVEHQSPLLPAIHDHQLPGDRDIREVA